MNLATIDLNLLVVLDAVLAERSVARAAARLHVTSPAVSNALARLRAVIGDPIVTRSGRGIVPTPRALALAPAVTRALRDIEGALAGETFDPRVAQVRLTLGIADAGQLARLPGLAARVAERMPVAQLRVVSVDTMLALGGIEGTEVDVAVGVSEPAPGIVREHVYDEQSVVIVRERHPRIGARAKVRDLAAEKHVEVHVALGKGSRAVTAAYARAGVTREVAVIVPTFTAAAAVVAETDLVATVPASVVGVLGPALGLREVATPLRIAPLPMFMSWHRRTHGDPARVLFRELVAEAARDPSRRARR
ncbi:MAG TPA: LysR family transcriptional regulator [Kofleriaceae bacterium]|nr:LysR family transcriptional regulator [Kofleriaceae bacterium]